MVMKKGDTHFNAKLPIAQARLEELIPFYVNWKDTCKQAVVVVLGLMYECIVVSVCTSV